ncbi:hypothetical protein ACVWYH_006079 [Bradyrhizobium sp. GM24.11]
MRLVSYYPEGRAMRRKIAMGVLVDDKVAPLTDIDSFYDHVPKWKERARSQFKGTMSLAERAGSANLNRAISGVSA